MDGERALGAAGGAPPRPVRRMGGMGHLSVADWAIMVSRIAPPTLDPSINVSHISTYHVRTHPQSPLVEAALLAAAAACVGAARRRRGGGGGGARGGRRRGERGRGARAGGAAGMRPLPGRGGGGDGRDPLRAGRLRQVDALRLRAGPPLRAPGAGQGRGRLLLPGLRGAGGSWVWIGTCVHVVCIC